AGLLQRLVRGGAGWPCPQPARNWGWPGSPWLLFYRGVRRRCPYGFWCCEPCAPPVGSIGLGSVFGPPVGDRRLPRLTGPRRILFGRLPPLPPPPPNALRPACPSGPRLASAAREADLPLQVAVLGARHPPDYLAHLPPGNNPATAHGQVIFPNVLTEFKLTSCGTSVPKEVPWAALRGGARLRKAPLRDATSPYRHSRR